MRWSRIAALAAVAALAWALFGRDGGPSTTAAPTRPPVLVKVSKAERRDVSFVVRAPGLVLAEESVAVNARFDSEVMEVHFREGDLVEAGQLLFTLDDRALIADLRRQEAQLATGMAELNNARRQFERSRRLANDGFESTATLDEARAAFESAEAQTVATKAEIDRLRVMLGYTRITAAIGGRAGVIHATVGNTVKANDAAQPLVTINRISPILVQFGLPQQALVLLRERMAAGEVAARVVRDGVVLAGEGKVEFVDNRIDRTTGSFEGRARFANTDESLWPGMIVEAELSLGEDAGATVVPEVAVQHGPSGDFVFVVDDGKAKRRPVTIRRYAESGAIVDRGVEPGETVAVDGMMSLSDGSPVEVAGAKAAGDAAAPAGSAAK